MFKVSLLTSLFLSPIFLLAQSTENVQQVWLGYFATATISKKISLTADFHVRTKNNYLHQVSTVAIRPSINYHFSPSFFASIGYAFFAFPNTNSYVLENRTWQQLQLQQPIATSKLTHRLRVEQRFRNIYSNNEDTKHNFNFRYRYLLGFQYPLSKTPFAKKTYSVAISNEVHVNSGNQTGLNSFDQNRFFIGLQYHIHKQTTFQIGYMLVYQQLNGYQQFRNIETIRLFVTQGFNLSN